MGIPQDVEKGLDLFRTLVFDNVVDAAITTYGASIAAIPIVGPIIFAFLRSLLLGFADTLYNKLGGEVILGTVLFVDVIHRQMFEHSSIGLKKIAIEKGINSPEFKVAHEKEKQDLKKFGQFNIVQPGLTKPK